MDGVHYFPNGFLAAADVNITSNLAFRQVFSDNIQQAISPEERSQVFVNKNAGDYSFNLLARNQVRLRTRASAYAICEHRFRSPFALSFLRSSRLFSFAAASKA